MAASQSDGLASRHGLIGDIVVEFREAHRSRRARLPGHLDSLWYLTL